MNNVSRRTIIKLNENPEFSDIAKLEKYAGTYYLTKSNNIADLVDLEQGGLIESEIYAALSVNKKSITIQCDEFTEKYALEQATSMFVFKLGTYSIYITSDFSELIIPKRIAGETKFYLISEADIAEYINSIAANQEAFGNQENVIGESMNRIINESKKNKYDTCEYCGAHLDKGEICTCRKDKEKEEAELVQMQQDYVKNKKDQDARRYDPDYIIPDEDQDETITNESFKISEYDTIEKANDHCNKLLDKLHSMSDDEMPSMWYENVYNQLARLKQKYQDLDLRNATPDDEHYIDSQLHHINVMQNKDKQNISEDYLLVLSVDDINIHENFTINSLYNQILDLNGYIVNESNIELLDKMALNEEILIEMRDETKAKIKNILKKIGKGLTFGALAGLSIAAITSLTGGAISGSLAKALSKFGNKVAASEPVSAIKGFAKGVGKAGAIATGVGAATGATVGAARAIRQNGKIDDETRNNSN